MSEEINEDNCVLDVDELDYITKAMDKFLRTDALNYEQFINVKASQIFQKINKLNDIVKYMEERGLLVYGGDAKLVLSKRGKEKLGISDE